jgi:hypothetical protein
MNNKKKYNRSNYFSKITIDGDVELDLSEGHFQLFTLTREVRHYQVSKYESMRPDIVSEAIYGTVDHWWVLLKFNDIVDIFTEFKEGFIIKVPNVVDIQNFNKKVRQAITKEDKVNKQIK